ncbi:aspartyl/asparaginyl beta-hydroxylase domain-containing protein [Sphingomonas sp.]|uniref:aspartyl/asparaginyl beta-hydroxylase domain-containing protein n=1 Tax=Sphingomonas sp. TaxID=28214 RepID=UPI0017E90FB7|nr:aspartyl/asparaginyl beta-hydroxylase domain-containing protein [Sphingomonas sp.]MBA3510348.1 aspartyl/asparaginyl beta-hydroxylase domain-containing protein [Sphingomonas sp.]
MSSAAETGKIRELLGRGDSRAGEGDARAAMSFYHAALGAARAVQYVDAQTMSDLRRAQAYVQQRASEFEQALDRAVESAGVSDPIGRQRLTHAMDMLKGKRSIYPQQPSVFYYPYLAQRQFWERDEFDWAQELEAQTPIIRAELEALLVDGADFRPYIEVEEDRPHRDFHGLHGDESWTALYLWKEGKVVEENARRCPQTMAALEKVPISRIGHRTPAVLFSRLLPGAHIPSHHGMLNSRLICHLPLIVPPGGWLRVGNEKREWREGELLIFDDSLEHEAKNPSGETRIILLFDVWKPELGQDEPAAISDIFDAIDTYSGASDD